MRGAFDRKVEKWGQIITADQVDSKSTRLLSLIGEKEALVVKDVMSGLKHIYPVKSKDADDTVMPLRHFCGEQLVTGLYSENSGELKTACRTAKILHEGSQPGVPQTNDVIERTNQDIVCDARCCLDAAGLPPYFWSFAALCYGLV